MGLLVALAPGVLLTEVRQGFACPPTGMAKGMPSSVGPSGY
jgi:hypothetical protein